MKIGDRYSLSAENYILSQAQKNRVTLISLQSGNRFVDPVHVIDALEIKPVEFYRIAGGEPENFKPLFAY